MHSFDPDLLAALADGSLPPDEAAALEARIAADPAAAADLAAQRLVQAGLAALPAVVLTDEERSRLHATVAERIGIAGSGVATAPRRRRVAWGAVAVGASALLALVAFGPVAGMLGEEKSGDDGGMLTAAITTAADQSEFDAAPLGLPPATPEVAGADGMPEGDAVARASESTPVVEDLMILKGDPEALVTLQQPVDDAVACRAEAAAFLGSDPATWFPYSLAAPDGTVVEYLVFLSPDAGAAGSWVLVAFPAADCTNPIPIP